jgi:hypothetical protein
MGSNIAAYLLAAGLGKYVDNFRGVSEEQFLTLMMSEYNSFGIQDMEVGGG